MTQTLQLPKPAACRIRVRFSRDAQAAQLSQLEQIRAFRKIAQDSGLPLACSGGKHNLVKLSFGPAIAVGYESEAEFVDIYLCAPATAAQALERLRAGASGGYAVLDVKKVPLNFPSVEALVNVAEYEIRGDFSNPPQSLEQFLERAEIIIEKVKPSGTRESIDARPLIKNMRLESGAVSLTLRFGPKKNLKPERILQAWLDRPVCADGGGCSIIRKQLYWEDAYGNLNAP